MIILASRIMSLPVISMRNGAKVGEVSGILIDPDRLEVAGLWVKVLSTRTNQLLVKQNIRELSFKGVVIDDIQDLSDAEDLPALSDILAIDYQIPEKTIRTISRKLGKAKDFGFHRDTYQITSIVGKPSLMNSWKTTESIYYREQIESIDDDSIQVNDSPVKSKLKRSLEKPQLRPSQGYSSTSSSASTTSE